MHIALITAGGAGMFCGSCMHDNTWARALRATPGVDVTLIPTYTPIRVDEENVSVDRVFLGGLNVYLEHKYPIWRKVPGPVRHLLDSPRLINFATRFSISSDARELGELTIEMLRGAAGPQRREIDELVEFLAGTLKPDVICFSNALLAGVVPPLRERFDGPIFCTLQGDDIFLRDLPEPYASQAIEMISEHARGFDGFLVHTRFYRDFMSRYLRLPAEKFHLLPLGIDLRGHDGRPELRNNGTFTIGYFARVCKEKGLHQLVDAVRLLHRRRPGVRVRAGGYLGPRDRSYFREVQRSARELGPAFEYVGSPATQAEKVALLKSIDLLSVPTVYEEPKGIFVVESLANGTPVVEPQHGAFPEMVERTGGGVLVPPGDPQALADALEQLVSDGERRLALARAGHASVHEHFSEKALAQATLRVFRNVPRRAADLPTTNGSTADHSGRSVLRARDA